MINKIILFYSFVFISNCYGQNNANLVVFTSGNYYITPVGQNETFTINVKNNGPDNAENVNCSIYVGNCFSNVSAITNIGLYSNNIWSIGNLQNGETVTLTMSNLMNTYCNCSYEIYPYVTSTTSDPYLPNNSCSVNYNWDTQSDMDLQCVPYTGSLQAGSTIYLNFNLVNHGYSDTCGFVNFNNSNGLTIVNGIPSSGTWNNQTKTWDSVLALVNQTYSIQLECFVNDPQNATISGYAQSNSFWEWVTDNNNCISVLSNLSTSHNSIEDRIKLTPNPAHDFINIINNKNEVIKNILIVDVYGKKVIERFNEYNQIDVSNLTKGLYLLKIETENGSFSQKIIKE